LLHFFKSVYIMGNTQNKDGEKKTLSKIIDFVATNYILTQNFQDMKKLSDMKYCNNLVILTSKVIENKLSDIEVEFLAQRLKQNEEVNEMTKEKIKYMDKTQLPNLDIKNQTQKRRMCIGIAKFYVKIAHIYSAIVTTIKPDYTYTMSTQGQASSGPQGQASSGPQGQASSGPQAQSSSGPQAQSSSGGEEMQSMLPSEVSLEQKQTIPSGAKVNVKVNNICSQRLNSLLNGQDMSGENVVVKPNFCKMNLDISANKSRSLVSEPGIPELSKLYYDKYDFDKGGFTGMTDKMRTGVYLEDVRKFYKVFTGETSVPSEIKTFSDIPLRSFHKSKGCKPGGPYLNEYKGTLKDRLFKEYADHINKMMKTTEDNQNKLLSQIDKLFVFNVNPVTNAREVTIVPNLTDIDLQKIVEETRNIIIDLYITCETDFLTGLEIFEAIVEKQIMDTSQVQMQELQKIVDRKLANSDLLEMPTEKKEPVPEPEPLPAVPVPAAPVPAAPVPAAPVPAAPVPAVPVPAAPVPPASIFSKIVNPISSLVAPIKNTFVSAPVTAPVTAPVIPAPVIPAPVIPAPVIPAPVIPAPEMPIIKTGPVTLEPVTLEPVTLEPVTLEPVTLEPVTLEPVTKL